MRLVQNIVKHPLKTALVLALITTIGCKSLENKVVNNSEILGKQNAAIEKVLIQDFEKLPGEYTPKYDTTTHKLMQMEKDFGANSWNYLLLDILIEKEKSKFDGKKEYNAIEAIATLDDIGKRFRPFQVEPEKPRSSLISQCLEDKRLDCDSLSLVYLSIGEEINLSMQLAIIPWHVFLRVNTKQGPINWDPTMVEDSRIILDSKYVDKDNIDSWPKILDTKGIFSLHYANLSGEWLNKYYNHEWQKNNGIKVNEEKGFDYLNKGLDYTNKAIELFPEMFGAYYNKGEILFCMGDYDNSLEAFKKADSLWHNETLALIGQGKNYYKLSEYDKALDVLTTAIEINPALTKAYDIRSKVWYEKGDRKKALADLKMAIELTAIGMR